ncbi:MAG: hypothetical protein WED00_18500 [Aquisalimonadaceae bacterium]
MPQLQDQGPGTHSVLIFLLAVFLVASPFTTWWMSAAAPWYFIYALWIAIIVLTWLLARRLRRDTD